MAKKPKPKKTTTQTVTKRSGIDKYSLDELDHIMLKQLFEYPSTTFDELAVLVKRTKGSVIARYKKPAFQRAFAEIRAKTWDIIQKGQNQAARRLLKLVQDPDKRIALEAARLLMGPILNKGEIKINTVQEVIHRTRFGDQGQLISDSVEVAKETPANTIDLIGDEYANLEVPDSNDNATVPSGHGEDGGHSKSGE